jgi:hypothetical protein
LKTPWTSLQYHFFFPYLFKNSSKIHSINSFLLYWFVSQYNSNWSYTSLFIKKFILCFFGLGGLKPFFALSNIVNYFLSIYIQKRAKSYPQSQINVMTTKTFLNQTYKSE